MALLKSSGYSGGSLEVDLGQDVEDVQKEQLQISNAELLKAINQENLTDKIFARILRNREKSMRNLIEAVPGAKEGA